MKDIYKMEFHSTIQLDHLLTVLRVPGGWLYTHNDNASTFVPWHDSGRQIASNGNYEELRDKLGKAEKKLKEAENTIFNLQSELFNPSESTRMRNM